MPVRPGFLKLTIILCMFLVLSLGPISGIDEKIQDKEKQKIQHEITVTANRIETNVKETASSITIITRADLLRVGKITVSEVLEDLTSLQIARNGPVGATASAQIRGANSEHTKVLLDGMELNDPISPSRSFNLSHLLIQDIDRIEILKGPQSTLYGSDALGGVINIITRQSRGKPEFHLTTLGGSYKTAAGSIEMVGGMDKFTYSLGLSHYQSQGFSAAGTQYEGNTEADGYRNTSFSGKFGLKIRDNINFDLSFRYYSAKTEIDNFGGPYGDDPNNLENNRAVFFLGQIRGLFLKNRWESLLKIGHTGYKRTYKNPVDNKNPYDSEDSIYLSSLMKLDWQNNFFIHETNTLTAGLEYLHERGESEYNSESLWGPYTSIFPHQKTGNIGLYLQDRAKIAEKLFFTIGTRYDDHSRSGASFTFRVAPVFFLKNTNTRLKATYGTGFKAPSLYQLFAPATFYGPTGNISLQPEKSIGWEAGIEQNFLNEKFTLGGTYFSNKFNNLIDFDFTQGFINLKKASTQGAEFTLKYKPLSNLIFTAAYTHSKSRDEDTLLPLVRRPENKWKASLIWILPEKADFTLTMIYTGKRDDNFYVGWTSTRVELDRYFLMNAVFSYELVHNVRFFIRLDNILNSEYEVIKGFDTPGFSLYGGLRTNF